MQGLDIGNLDLEIDAATERIFERRRTKAPSRSATSSSGRIQEGRAERADIEGERPVETGDVEFEGGTAHGGDHTKDGSRR